MQNPQRPKTPNSKTETPKESLLNRLLITPLTFLSFILSLALISNHNTASRLHRTSPNSKSPLLRHIPRSLQSFFFISSAAEKNPYAYVKKPAGGDGLVRNVGQGRGEEWFWHNNQKKLFKMEVGEALELRKWVVVGLVGSVGVGVGCGVWGVGKLWGRFGLMA